jgi:hypothetical protein
MPGLFDDTLKHLTELSPQDWVTRGGWTAAPTTLFLMGLRYYQAIIKTLLQGVVRMKESVTYQAILEKGAAKEARKILLLLGQDQLGEPSENVRATVEAITDVDRLNDLIVRLKPAASWQELMGLPDSRRRSPRRKPTN